MADYRDRRAGLILFGIVEILIGLGCVGLVLLTAAGQEMAERRGYRPSGGPLASALVVYGLAAVYFVTTGIGSIRLRRWARSLSLVVSAIWLVGGSVATLMFAVMIARRFVNVGAPGLPLLASFVVGIVVPSVLLAFYRSPHVRATCEANDTTSRWTERTPLPVLAVAVMLAFTSVALLANLADPTVALPGRVITGAPAAIALFAMAILCAFLSIQVYRLEEMAWWSLLLLQIAGMGFALYAYASGALHHGSRKAGETGLSEIYRDPLFIAAFAATWIAYFAFVLYLRRYFALGLVPRTRREDQSRFSG